MKAIDSLLSGDPSVRNELIEAEGNSMDDTLCRYLSQAAEVFASAFTGGKIIYLEFVSLKLQLSFSSFSIYSFHMD